MEQKEETAINDYGVRKTNYYTVPVNGFKELYCVKSARKVELKADKEVILSSMLRSMQRDCPRKLHYDVCDLIEEEK